MRILNISCTNFCSYPTLEMDFTDMGLALIHGKTGAGKSTILDAVCWGLYGVTAKGTTADGVRPLNENTQPTTVSVSVKLTSGICEITRIRGKGANDLYWTSKGATFRGKDLTESQQLLNDGLGVDADTFIAASYYHEFSPTGAFFIAKAKERRELFEQLAPLELPNKLSEKMSALVKKTKDQIAKKELEKERSIGKQEQLESQHKSTIRSVANWEKEKAKSVIELEKLHDSFEKDKDDNILGLSTKMVNLMTEITEQGVVLDEANAKSPRCNECGQSIHDNTNNAVLQARKYQHLNREYERAADIREDITNSENNYAGQIKREKARINPFHAEQEKIALNIAEHQAAIGDLNRVLRAVYASNGSYKVLYDLSALLRGELLQKAVADVQDATNGYLEKYFDAELRVRFQLESDTLEAIVLKNGYECAYKQLSKGQRGLLKLCFSVAVQEAVSNNKGVHFANLFFDESLDGLDDELKQRSFHLFEHLSLTHESILIIDHNESFQRSFQKSFKVTMEGDQSSLIQE